MRTAETTFSKIPSFVSYTNEDGLKEHYTEPVTTDTQAPAFVVYQKFTGEKPSSIKKEEKNYPPQLLIQTKDLGLIGSHLSPDFQKDSPQLETQVEMPLPQSVIDLCQQIRGIGGYALVVGGNVRDALISVFQDKRRIPSKDVDLEVYGLSFHDLYHLLIVSFGEQNLNMVGKAFGVIKLKLPDLEEPIDISIPRTDSKVDTGHKGFVINGDPRMTIAQAGQRRDLVINSISYDPLTKTVFDPFGAKHDFKNQVISITDQEKFIEDPLRVLRLMQFIGRFEMLPTTETIAVCKKLLDSGELDHLPADRTTEELKKLLLKGRRPSLGFKFALEIGLVEKYWPELFVLINKPQNPRWHPEGDVWNHTLQTIDAAIVIANRENLNQQEKLVLVLTMLCHDFGKATKTIFKDGAWRSPGHEKAGLEPTEEFLSKFKFSQETIDKVLVLVAEHMQPKKLWLDQFPSDGREPIDTSKAQRRLASRLDQGKANMYLLALVAEADQRGRNGENDLFLDRDQVDQLNQWQTWFLESAEKLNISEQGPQSLIQGRDLLNKFKLKKGGLGIGVLLKMVYLDQLDGNVNSLEEALDKSQIYLNDFIKKFNIDPQDQKIMLNTNWSPLQRLEDPREGLLQSA